MLPPRIDNRAEYPFEGLIIFQGLHIDVENVEGSVRRGVDADGTAWSVTMRAHYGELRETLGTDGDHLDCYVGPYADSSLVVVVHQQDPRTREFDEDKVLLGFRTVDEALALYRQQYNRPGFYGGHTTLSIGGFRRWCENPANHGRRIIRKAATGAPPGPGWQRVPGGKGWRRPSHRLGRNWEYAYPGDAATARVSDGHDEGRGWSHKVDPRLPPPFSYLTRRYRDDDYTVFVYPDRTGKPRFKWRDQEFSSLSAAGKAITGRETNGFAFFGITEPWRRVHPKPEPTPPPPKPEPTPPEHWPAGVDPRLPPPFAVVERQYKGKTYSVLIRPNDKGLPKFVHAGKQFTSLSAVGKAITGKETNGFAFFGLKRPWAEGATKPPPAPDFKPFKPEPTKPEPTPPEATHSTLFGHNVVSLSNTDPDRRAAVYRAAGVEALHIVERDGIQGLFQLLADEHGGASGERRWRNFIDHKLSPVTSLTQRDADSIFKRTTKLLGAMWTNDGYKALRLGDLGRDNRKATLVLRKEYEKGQYFRAYYTNRTRIANATDVRAAVHELGHWIEYQQGGYGSHLINRACLEFRDRRGVGGPRPLSVLTGSMFYGPREEALADKFIDPYVGKVYPHENLTDNSATEVFSMGLENLIDSRRAKGFMKADPEHAGLILAVLTGRVTA